MMSLLESDKPDDVEVENRVWQAMWPCAGLMLRLQEIGNGVGCANFKDAMDEKYSLPFEFEQWKAAQGRLSRGNHDGRYQQSSKTPLNAVRARIPLSCPNTQSNVINGLCEQEDSWHFISAWKQSTTFTYTVPFVMSTTELKQAMRQNSSSSSTPATQTVHTRVTPSLSGIVLEHFTTHTRFNYRVKTSSETCDTPSPSSFIRLERRSWSTKEDAANVLSNLAMVIQENSFEKVPPVEPIQTWLGGTCVSEYWLNHARFFSTNAFSTDDFCIDVEGTLCSTISESILPNTVKPTRVKTGFEKTFIHQRLPIRIIFVIEGEGETYAEAEQMLWGSGAALGVVVEYALPESACPKHQLIHKAKAMWEIVMGIVDICRPGVKQLIMDRDVGHGAALHTYSFVCRAPPSTASILAELHKAHTQALEFASGRLHKNANDILHQWLNLYESTPPASSSHPDTPPAHTSSQSSPSTQHLTTGTTNSLSTSGKMPRLYSADLSSPFIHRPKLLQVEAEPSWWLQSPPCFPLAKYQRVSLWLSEFL